MGKVSLHEDQPELLHAHHRIHVVQLIELAHLRGGEEEEGVGSEEGRKKVSYFMSAYLEHEDGVEVVLLDAPPLPQGRGQPLQVLRGDLWAGQHVPTQPARREGGGAHLQGPRVEIWVVY